MMMSEETEAQENAQEQTDEADAEVEAGAAEAVEVEAEAGTEAEVEAEAETTAEPEKPAKPRPIPEVVEFKHPFFSAVPGIYFKIQEGTDDAVMMTPLDTGAVELRLDSIAKELRLDEDSKDSFMRETLVDALPFVPQLKVGDAIPMELRTGEATWSITDDDRSVARGRVTMQLVSWLSGDESVVTDKEQLAMVTEDPAMKEKISDAFTQAADKLGLGDNVEKVVDLVDSLAEELSYIEALRRQFERILVVEERLRDMRELYRSELGIMETLNPVSRLCKIAMDGFRANFVDVDAQTGEIMAVLRNIGAQIKYIRTNRDNLYKRFWAWKELVDSWELQPAKRSRSCENMMQETYQFLAQRFLPENEWELFTKAQENAQNQSESMW